MTPKEFLPQMETIAREAGALLLDYFRRRIGFEYKGDVDLVTEADRQSEALVTRGFKSCGRITTWWAKRARGEAGQ